MTATLTAPTEAPTAEDAEVPEPYVLTVDALRALGACYQYVGRFRRAFSRGAALTEERCVRNAQKWDWHWIATYALTAEGLRRFSQEFRQHDDRFGKTLDRLRGERRKAQELLAPSHPRVAEAQRTYDAAYDRALGRLCRETARTFARLLPTHANERFVRLARGGNGG